MNKLEPPDSHFVRAAEGWLELGNPVEAGVEVKLVAPEYFDHPAVLRVRWDILAAQKRWEEALSVSEKQIQSMPKDPDGYIRHANTLYFMGRTAEARDQVIPLLKQFPKHPSFLYNLACYECQLGNLEEARRWLDKALEQSSHLRPLAMVDPDLEPLRAKNKL